MLIALGVAVAAWLLVILGLFVAGRGPQAREVALLIPNLLGLFRGLLRDDRVPMRSKLLIGFAVVWLLSPIDVVPEFIPVAGPLDDAIVAALVLRWVLKRTDPAVLSQYWRGDPAVLERLAGTRRR